MTEKLNSSSQEVASEIPKGEFESKKTTPIEDVAISHEQRLERVREVLTRNDGEPLDRYLPRAQEALYAREKAGGVSLRKSTTTTLSPELRALLQKVAKEAESQDEVLLTPAEVRELNMKEFDRISAAVAIGTAPISAHEEHSAEAFRKTEQGRKFFGRGAGGSAAKENYWTKLFFNYNSPEAQTMAHTELEGKRVILFGGGNAEIGKELSASGIAPEVVVNVDPYADGDSASLDRRLEVPAEDPELIQRLAAEGVPDADVILAMFSVPFYYRSEDQIRGMLDNAVSLLRQGGALRIWPLTLDDMHDEATNNRRVAALRTGLARMAASGDILLTRLGDGLVVRKVRHAPVRQFEMEDELVNRKYENLPKQSGFGKRES